MKFFLYILVVLLLTGCKQRYDPPVQSPVTGYLVVDGVINSGPGTASITLSRTTKFENKNMVYEKGALVKLEGEDNSMYTLVEKTQGQYSIDNISLDAGKKYRLRITVTGSKVYLSDFSTVKNNPPIDSCWQFNSPTNLSLGSTAKESQDIVYLPIAFVPQASIKLGVLYSLHVKQITWSQEGYEFLERMKKNTESTGTIFDPQPSELNGNIHCVTDAGEPVIGYFNICPLQEKRIFIQSSEVPSWNYSAGCSTILIPNISDSIVANGGMSLMPTIVGMSSLSGAIITFYAAPSECVDCTLSGTNKKPAYWP